jgi:hypothetical protein
MPILDFSKVTLVTLIAWHFSYPFAKKRLYYALAKVAEVLFKSFIWL